MSLKKEPQFYFFSEFSFELNVVLEQKSGKIKLRRFEKINYNRCNGILVPVRTSFGLRRRSGKT